MPDMDLSQAVSTPNGAVNGHLKKSTLDTASNFITELLIQQQQFYALEWLCHFGVLECIPLQPSAASYADVAKRTNVPKSTLRSIARMAMTADFLSETTDGQLSHNVLSASFVQNRGLKRQLLHMVEQTVPVMAGLTAATEKWGQTTALNETAYNVAMKTELSFFDHLKSRPDLSDEFDDYMKSKITSHSGNSVEYLLKGFDWSSLGEALVVDVGGGAGESTTLLASANPHLKFVIEDLARPISNARARVSSMPDEISKRIQLQEYDFFTPQPIKDADVYLLRTIIHDWPNIDAIRILKNIVDAMKPSSRILIMDMVLPVPGAAPKLFEGALRQKDLAMLQAFNARERESDDWYALVAQTDSRLRIRAIERPEGSQLSVIEIGFSEARTNGANGVNGEHAH